MLSCGWGKAVYLDMQTWPWALFALSYGCSATVIVKTTSPLKSPKPLLAQFTGEVAAVSMGSLGQNSQFPHSPLWFSFIKQLSIYTEQNGLWKCSLFAASYMSRNSAFRNDTRHCHIDSIPMAIWLSSSSSIFHQRTVLCHTQIETGRCPYIQHWYSCCNQRPGHSQPHRLCTSWMAPEYCRAVNSRYYLMYTFTQHMAVMSLLLQLCGHGTK